MSSLYKHGSQSILNVTYGNSHKILENHPSRTWHTANYIGPISGQYIQKDLDFYNTVTQFYKSFVSKQERLGKEYEKILYDNLWDLYES